MAKFYEVKNWRDYRKNEPITELFIIVCPVYCIVQNIKSLDVSGLWSPVFGVHVDNGLKPCRPSA